MSVKLFDVVICVVLLILILVLVVAVSQEEENEAWINWPKLFNDCSEKVSVEEANRCAEFGYPGDDDVASLECFERCLK